MNVLRARDRAPLHFSTIGAIHGAFSLFAGVGTDLSDLRSGVEPAGSPAAARASTSARWTGRNSPAACCARSSPACSACCPTAACRTSSCCTCWCPASTRARAGAASSTSRNDRHALDPAARAACAEAGAAAPPPCDRFQAVVDRLTRHGRLLFNGYTRLVPLGPRLTRGAGGGARRCWRPRARPGWRSARTGRAGGSTAPTEQIVICVPSAPGVMPRYTALALDRDAPQVSALPQGGDPCTADEVADTPIPGRPRRTGGLVLVPALRGRVLAYLGAVQRREEEGVPYRITVGLDAARSATPRLFRLWPEPRPGRASPSSTAGARWWVAEHDAAEDLTLSVLALTTQLLNLQKSADEIPSSRTLRLVR